jgi:glycosyltransferase involved in cell wall biosynthesis
MAVTSPYTVRHIDLSSEETVNLSDAQQYYFVFWYKTIPLGQFYSSSNSLLTESFFWKVCLKSILPALKHYSEKLSPPYQVVETGSVDGSLIRHICKNIFEQIITDQLPKQLPVSVVICTRDRAEYLKKCLRAMEQQSSIPGEFIVVDNASVDQSTRDVALQFKNVKYVREDTPGLDVARNTGARNASFSIIAYTDDDTTPHRHWVYQVYKTFEDDTVAAMTGLVVAASLQTEAQLIFEKYWPFNRGYVDKIFDKDFFDRTVSTGCPAWEVGAGANMAFRKEVFEKVGYFDERLDVGAAGCSGDSEIWYRILANEKTIVYNPRAVVHHHHRESLASLKRQLYFYMRGFTVAILIQYNRFGHKGNIRHLFSAVPRYYLKLLWKGFPFYKFQHQTLLSEISGIFSGLLFYVKHRNTDPKIFPPDEKH